MGELSNLFVVLMGMGTVFVGLICIVILVQITGVICQKTAKEETKAEPVQQTAAPAKTVIANRQEMIAAVSAAIAEDLGADISAIRILSVKEI